MRSRIEDLVDDPARVRRPGHLREKDRELVSAEASHRVFAAHAAPNPVGQLHQHAIAQAVAKGVVDRLEAVQIEVEDCEAAPLSRGVRDGQAQAIVEEALVRQPCQLVVVREAAEVLLLLLHGRERGPQAIPLPHRLAQALEQAGAEAPPASDRGHRFG